MRKKLPHKPKTHKRVLLDYNECAHWIEKKYKVQLRDFAKSHDHFDIWCDTQGLGEKDPEGNDRNSSQLFYKQYRTHPEGEAKRPAYLDFWHWIIDRYNISNGCTFSLLVEENCPDNQETWVNEILTMFRDEFNKDIKNGELEFEVWW